jgi:hypothetical protein
LHVLHRKPPYDVADNRCSPHATANGRRSAQIRVSCHRPILPTRSRPNDIIAAATHLSPWRLHSGRSCVLHDRE